MNAPQNTPENVGATRGRGRGGARGRGGGRGGSPAITRVIGATNVATNAKIGPARLCEPTWVEEASLKGKSFVIWVGGGTSAPQQVTIHRPIGVTPLSEQQWVATPTAEIQLLLERRSSEELARWERACSAATRAAILGDGIGRRLIGAQGSQKEHWAIEGTPECGPTIQTAMAAAKAAGQPEAKWLDFVSDAVKRAEARFKQELASVNRREAYAARHPKPRYETKGGPLGDRPQQAVEYLNGLSLAAARDKVTAAVYGRLQLVEVVREVLVERIDQDEYNDDDVQDVATGSGA